MKSPKGQKVLKYLMDDPMCSSVPSSLNMKAHYYAIQGPCAQRCLVMGRPGYCLYSVRFELNTEVRKCTQPSVVESSSSENRSVNNLFC